MDENTRVGKWQRARWAAILVGFLASALLVWQASYAAFSATTDNAGNTWSAGTVVLSDDDSSSVMFTVNAMKPGDTSSHCIQLTYTGNLAASIRLYGSVTPGSPDLSPYVQLEVDQGSGGSFADCTGFTADTSAPVLFTGTLGGTTSPFSATDWTNGKTTAFAPTGGAPQTYTYKFVTTLDPNAPNAAQGGSVTVTFTWEAQNT